MSVEGDVNFSPARAAWSVRHIDDATRELLDADADVFLHQSLSTPCLNALVGSKGSWLFDAQGRRILDFHGNSVHQIGHGHPKVIEAITAALDTLPFCPRRYTNRDAVALADRLVELSPPSLSRVLFAPSGAAAIGMALKLARLATGRFKTVSMWDAFHGATLDAISIGGEAQFRRGVGPLLPGAEHVPPPDPLRCPLGCGGTCQLTCASYLEYVLDHEGDVAAVIAEPIRCTTAAVPPPEYWRRVREACDRNGTLLIFDEIPVALGRTGTMFAMEHTGVVPDMVVIGKGLGGGIFPLAALLARAEFDTVHEASIGHFTHEKSSVGAAAALATLQVLEDEELLARSQTFGAEMKQRLATLGERHPSIRTVRGIGMLLGVELRSAALAEHVLYGCLERGLNFKVSSGTVLTLTPPLNLSETELEFALDVLDQAIGAAEAAISA